MRHKAVGIHVFAGGFSGGVKEVFDVDLQLETHGFALDTAKQSWGVDSHNSDWREWPDVPAQFAYGNPRCTGFSTVTSGYDENTHGAWAKQTCDIHEFCNYVVKQDYPIAIWESVQQAFSTGRPLLDYLRDELFLPNGYRIAHILMCGHSFGNCQRRKRYFFVAYKRGKNFNIVPPTLPHSYYPVLWDVIKDTRYEEGKVMERDGEYDANTYCKLTQDEWDCLEWLPNGMSLNGLARHGKNVLPRKMKLTWEMRSSEMPFSMHCIFRTNWLRPCPTLHSSCGRLIHPEQHRPLLIGELAKIMGWGDRIPVGKGPVAQLAKGVVPAAGKWLAEQAERYLNDEWGDEDWYSKFQWKKKVWEGANADGADEKVFHLSEYHGRDFNIERYPEDIRIQKHRWNIDPDTGEYRRPWGSLGSSLKEYQDARVQHNT